MLGNSNGEENTLKKKKKKKIDRDIKVNNMNARVTMHLQNPKLDLLFFFLVLHKFKIQQREKKEGPSAGVVFEHYQSLGNAK